MLGLAWLVVNVGRGSKRRLLAEAGLWLLQEMKYLKKPFSSESFEGLRCSGSMEKEEF